MQNNKDNKKTEKIKGYQYNIDMRRGFVITNL